VAVINSCEGMVIHARVKYDVLPLRRSTIFGKNDCNLIRRWEIVPPSILSRHDAKLNVSIRVIRILLEKLVCMLEFVCVSVEF